MSTTYTAWDGEQRPWPPPENWYRAADGRWWHPAHGPEEPTDDQSNALPVWDFTDSTDLDESSESTEADVTDSPPDGGLDLRRRRETSTGDAPAVNPAAQTDRGSDGGARPETPEPARWKWIVAAIVVILGLAVGAQVILGGVGNEVSTESTGVGAEEDDDGANTSDDEPIITDDPPDATATDPEVAATVADFRRQLSEHDLATDDLTDDQITTFASTYCVYAGGAEDLAAFDELRQVAVTNSQSNLTPTQLNITINTAIQVFCPAEADRLGITDETAP